MEEKQIVISCSDDLWKYIQDLKEKGIDKLSIIQIAKIYSELNKMIGKVNENEKESK